MTRDGERLHRFYREVCSATLKPVLDALVIAREEGVWLEVTNLVIPTLNDDDAMDVACKPGRVSASRTRLSTRKRDA